MFTIGITLFTALLLSVVAAYFSVIGLMAIFASAAVPIAIMGGTLELAKVVSASWVYRNWRIAPRLVLYYLTVAIVVLSFITSLGVFGYLSKAHLDQAIPSGDIISKLALVDEKIKIERDNIDVNRKALKQLDEAVDQVMARSTDEKGAERAATIRRTQQKDRNRILEDINKSQTKITSLNEERAPIASDVRKVEAEVGPIKYIAALVYGESTDSTVLEQAVRWVIVMIVFVFDPLAILLLIAANISLQNYKNSRNETPGGLNIPIPEDDTTPIFSNPPSPETTESRNWSDKNSEWSPSLSNVTKDDDNKVRIDRSKIHEMPKEILEKFFRR